MSMDHEHRHDHHHDDGAGHAPHPTQPDDGSPPGRYEVMTLAMRDLLIEKGFVTAEQIRRDFEMLDSWQPSRGAQIVGPAIIALGLDDALISLAGRRLDWARDEAPVVQAVAFAFLDRLALKRLRIHRKRIAECRFHYARDMALGNIADAEIERSP